MTVPGRNPLIAESRDVALSTVFDDHNASPSRRAQSLPSYLPLILPVEPSFYTYREKLWPLYQGLALWKPNSGDLYDRVSIGDVGYVYEGAFFRMFNVRLPWDDESNRNFGIQTPTIL